MECEEHENLISLVCVTCENKLLCIECVDDHPKGHHFSSVKAVTRKVKSEKNELLRSIDEDVTTLKKEITAVRATRKQQDDIEKEENQKINDHRATIHSIVDEIADNQLKFSEIQKIKNISLLQEDEEFLTKQLQERIAYGEAIRDMLESTDGTEMLQKTNKINPVTPLSFPPTPLQALKFCEGQINEDQIRFMFGRMMDSPEEAEVVSDFVGSIRLKSPDIDDTKKQETKTSRSKISIQIGNDSPAISTLKKLQITIYIGSLLHLDVDCIVNFANENLQHGGGIAHAISQAAGYELDKECRNFIAQNGPLNVGECCTTTAGKLGYKGVIHAVGPRWRPKDQINCLSELKEAVLNSLLECDYQNFKSVAIPAISSGIFGVLRELCAQQYYKGVVEYSKQRTKRSGLREVHFVDKDQKMVILIQKTFRDNIG